MKLRKFNVEKFESESGEVFDDIFRAKTSQLAEAFKEKFRLAFKIVRGASDDQEILDFSWFLAHKIVYENVEPERVKEVFDLIDFEEILNVEIEESKPS